MDKIKEQLREHRIMAAFDAFNKSNGNKYTLVGKMNAGGAFAAVYEVKDNYGRKIVMKAVDSTITELELTPGEVCEYVKKEIKTMMLLKDCPYVMELLDHVDVCIDERKNDHVYLLLMPKMTVASEYFIQNSNNTPARVLAMTADICRALEFCHAKKILHRDIKPQNLYYSSEKGHFVLADFGVSRTLFNHDRAVTRIGSLLAPEIMAFQDLRGRMNSDIFSLGMTALWINAEMSTLDEVIAEKFNSLPADVKDILMKAIDGNPATRYQTARDMLNDIERVAPAASHAGNHKSQVQQCVDAFMKKQYTEALQIAKAGAQTHTPVMICLYAYLLACQKKTDEALAVLSPLADRGDAVATGLYGIIGRMAVVGKDAAKDQEMIKLIFRSAQSNFSVAQYYIGRWMIDGESGFATDTEKGTAFIFESFNRGFLPAMDYFRKALKRNPDRFVSVESMQNLMDIALKDFSKEKYPQAIVLAVVAAY